MIHSPRNADPAVKIFVSDDAGGTTQFKNDGPAANKHDQTATKHDPAIQVTNHDRHATIQASYPQRSPHRSAGEPSSRLRQSPAMAHSSPATARRNPATSHKSPALNLPKARARNNSERVVRIQLQDDVSGNQPGRSGVNTLGMELGYMGREPSNSSIYSDLTSIEGMISPNPRAAGGGRFNYDNLPTSAGEPSSARRDNCYPPHNAIAASKLVHELSPMIKRKVISAMQSVQNAGNNVQPSAKSNRHLALLSVLFCPPLGCLAWHHASKVPRFVAENDFISARISSKMAATYAYIGFLIGGLLLASIFVFFVCSQS